MRLRDVVDCLEKMGLFSQPQSKEAGRGAPLVRIERRTRLKASVSAVFDYIADFRTIKDYNPSVFQVNGPVDGSPAKGSRYEITLYMFGWKIRPALTITDMKENELIVTRFDSAIQAIEKRLFKQAGNETDFHFIIESSSG